MNPFANRHDIALVVPTIREASFARFIEEWHRAGLFEHVDLIIIEDNPKATFGVNQALREITDVVHFSWEDIDRELGSASWIIPRRSDTVRSFGYWYAWKREYDYVLTLDDDVYPPTQSDGIVYENARAFLDEHLKYLDGYTRWFNTLSTAKPRGLPFYNLGRKKNVVLNHGLWTNVLDYDAPTQLSNPTRERFANDNRLVPQGQYFPMCGMNLMFKRSAIVLTYHLLMGQLWDRMANGGTGGLTKLPFDRWGDIGCGIILKRICDLTDLSVASGMPYARHDRASNVFANLRKEAAVLEVNEKLWEYVDSFFPSDDAVIDGLPAVYSEMGGHIMRWDAFPEYGEYFSLLGRAMKEWARLFQ